MSLEQIYPVKYPDWQKFLVKPPLISSFQAGWSNIQISHHCQTQIEFPEFSHSEHVIIVPLGRQAFDMEFMAEGRARQVSYREEDFAKGCIEIEPADRLYSVRCTTKGALVEWVQCYVQPKFVSQIARECIDPDRVELKLTYNYADLLLRHTCLALKSILEVDGGSDRFYVDSMATALSAHLLRHYSNCDRSFREHEGGLPKPMLKRATDYIQTHLTENLSLSEISQELGISQYYFCRLFKQSLGISPHQYLMRERIKRATYLLKKKESQVTSVALACGFADRSHFAKYFRKFTGMNPQEFRNL